MLFEAAGFTDVGTTKKSNQDSYCIKIANTDMGQVALVAVADGMGGLAKGELASSTVIRRLSEWFETELPMSLEIMDDSIQGLESYLTGQWNGLVQELNLKIMRYGREEGMNLGTTLTAMLCIGARYSIVHVGDTRIYEISPTGAVKQLTEDQTFVHREVVAGRMTPQEAAIHPKRNVLLQCVGSSKSVEPAIVHGNSQKDACYVVCSDGFRHVLSVEQIARIGSFSKEPTPEARARATEDYLAELTRYVEEHGETDNITSVALFTRGGSY